MQWSDMFSWGNHTLQDLPEAGLAHVAADPGRSQDDPDQPRDQEPQEQVGRHGRGHGPARLQDGKRQIHFV